MQFEDTTRIDTPEGISLELILAGLGSRFIAQLIDVIVKVVALLAILWVAPAVDGSGTAATIGVSVGVFAAFFIYDIVLETLWSGRTIGKNAAGIRVVTVGGGEIGFFKSAVRNLLRVVDILPGPYGVGMLFVIFTKRNQRLGDLAGGTLVVRDRSAREPGTSVRLPDRELPAGFDATAVTEEHAALARHYLARRIDLDPLRRRQLAEEVASKLRPLVGPTGQSMTAEGLIEAVVVAKDR